MGQFIKEQLPDPQAYYEGQGLVLQKGGKQWRTTRCAFHGGSDSMRVHLPSGAFVCMACCGARGGDVLAYHMAAHGLDFVEAAQALGAWREDPAQGHGKAQGKAQGTPHGKPHGQPHDQPPEKRQRRPAQPSPRSVMSLVHSELMLCAVLVADALRGPLSEEDAARFREAVGRIRFAAHFAGIEEEAHD